MALAAWEACIPRSMIRFSEVKGGGDSRTTHEYRLARDMILPAQVMALILDRVDLDQGSRVDEVDHQAASVGEWADSEAAI